MSSLLPTVDRVAAARHICQEARVVLTSLRGGPPHVARGDLAADLMELRGSLPACLLDDNNNNNNNNDNVNHDSTRLGGPYARPFLQVVMDPRAAGPHTLVALRAIHRLLQTGALLAFGASLAEVTAGVLQCKFEQTDPGADEAVEMAIADTVCALVVASCSSATDQAKIPTELLTDAFNTVFVTRNTFCHSPAMCYHFEDVLSQMVVTVFDSTGTHAPRAVLEYLVNQLLHTPLVGGEGLDESTRDAQQAHDATRVLCLRLVRTALQVGWSSKSGSTTKMDDPSFLVQLLQDDLCLGLLMTGQAIWAYHDAHSNISPGFVSLAVLSEICATISLLWHTVALRRRLTAQFETIFTGFYTRALVLLRQRRQPADSLQFNANLTFDAEVEIILESLVDLFCLHDHSHSVADNGDGGSLETLFCVYDCHLHRSDVAMGLMVELCRCCGGAVDQDDSGDVGFSKDDGDVHDLEALAVPQWRHVPAHLKELCAQAIVGGMKCLFRNDHASADTTLERTKRNRSILLRQLDHMADTTDNTAASAAGHKLRDLKSKKRLMRKAARIFNKKASSGISFLLDAGLVEEVTPTSIAAFLRNGIVVGLDKKQVGAYLGEAGKSPVAGKSPPSWERDWFHKEVLQIYCSLFRFEKQSLLDGLRMFLAAFRLPGEAQQIDRILQAFSDSCGQVCEESVNGLKLFSEDPKRASDAAYLLSFSIIMLNTDLHNANIREDRKMSCDDFFRNNMDYGRDITEKGKELPREYLDGIYRSIREEEFRTEGEGADGAMTVERWKDVIRCSQHEEVEVFSPSQRDAEDLTELVLEHAWKPIVSAIGALWGSSSSPYTDKTRTAKNPSQIAHSGMLGVQGARLGMDMSLDLMGGVRQLGRLDIYHKIFSCVCAFTGLLGDYIEDGVERTWALTNSVEAQSAVVVAFKIATEAGEDLDEDCWKLVWSILFELRDLKLISRGKAENNRSIFHESDADILSEGARRDWNMCLVKGDMEANVSSSAQKKGSTVGAMFGVFGRALFGSDQSPYKDSRGSPDESIYEQVRSAHGKEELVVWDEGAPSDDENENYVSTDGQESFPVLPVAAISAGAHFESLVIRESMDMSRKMDMPVTGLERVEDTRRYQLSPRARVRDRFLNICNIESIVGDSRFMDEEGIRSLLQALVALIAQCSSPNGKLRVEVTLQQKDIERSTSTSDISSTASSFVSAPSNVPLSPASESFAEVLLCEIALKNKDRIKALWTDVLQNHYLSRLTSILVNPAEGNLSTKIPVDPGLEKRVSGLIRLSISAIQRNDLADEVLSSWKYLLPMNSEQHATSPLRALDRHMGEGLWRIVARADDLLNLKADGWEGLVSLIKWCAVRGSSLKPIRSRDPKSVLPEDDVAIQSYRSLHLILSTKELEERVPCSIAECLRISVSAGERRNYSQLSIATLDLLGVLHETKTGSVTTLSEAEQSNFWKTSWRKIVEAIGEASEQSSDSVGLTLASIFHRVWIATTLSSTSLVFFSRTSDNIPFPCSRISYLTRKEDLFLFSSCVDC
jgi:hypothetical protein